jgi:phosphatidate cytidylyltransferase
MLRTRIASAAAMAAVLIAALLSLGPFGWAIFVFVILCVAGWEWGGFARLSPAGRTALAISIGAACLAAAAWTGLLRGAPVESRSALFYGVAAGFWLLVATVWLARNPQRPGVVVLLGAAVLALVPAYLAVLELRLRGPVVFLLVGGIVWTADVAAYFAGRAFGRHKLAPSISPGKSWEGVVGGLVAVGIYAFFAAGYFAREAGVPAIIHVMVPASLGLAAISVVGDLFESALKRQAGLKDSGRILPGHGGVLDRIDALMPVLPLAMLGTLLLGQTR